MRVLFAAFLAGSALVVSACSDGGENILRRQSSVAPERTPASNTSKGGDESAKPTPDPSPPPPSSTPAPNTSPAPDAGAPATPKPAPTPGSCGAPKCFAVGGYAGCKATGVAGEVVTMGCQDGACACFAGHQTTARFDGAPAGADEASQLFLVNCDCQ